MRLGRVVMATTASPLRRCRCLLARSGTSWRKGAVARRTGVVYLAGKNKASRNGSRNSPSTTFIIFMVPPSSQ